MLQRGGVDLMAYLDYFELVLSRHYFEGLGELFEAAVAKPLDNLIAAAKQATAQRFWAYALDEALPYLLQNYNLDKIEAFTPDQTRQQLDDAWTTWERAGSEEGILAEVNRLGYSRASMLPVWLSRQSNDGTTDTIECQPSLLPDRNRLFWPVGSAAPDYMTTHSRNIATQGEWGDGWWVDINYHFSSFFIVIHDPPFAFRRWGDPAFWGKDLRWDALVVGDRVALRRLYLEIKKFNAAEWSCRGVVFTYSGRYTLAPVLLGVSVRTTYDIWAVGGSGYSAHWNGYAWTQVQTPTTAQLFGVFSTPTAVYAVGNTGTILRWTGSAWVSEPSGTLLRLSGFAYTGTLLWICGQNGVLLFNAGFGWVTAATPVATSLVRMFAFSPHDIWAVGDSGVAIHYNGATWSTTVTGVAVDLYGIWGDRPDRVWAVGLNGTIIRWDGAAWNPVVSPTTHHLYAIAGMKNGRAVATGETLIYFDGTDWKQAQGSLGLERSFAIDGTVSDNFWAVTEQGTAFNVTIGGRVFTGAPWNAFQWNDGTRYNPKYLIKWIKENWET
jgi:hypothetical protein